MNRKLMLKALARGMVAGIAACFMFGAMASPDTWEIDPETGRRIAPGLPPLSSTLPKITLLTQDNKKVRLYEDLIKDKIVMINMFYINCEDGKCPGVAANLAKLQKKLGKKLGRDVHIYSISLDPEKDTPKELKKYAQSVGARPGWTFLTGEKDDIEALRRRLGFWSPDPVRDAKRFSHTGILLLANDKLDRWMATPSMGKIKIIMRDLDIVTQQVAVYPESLRRNNKVVVHPQRL